MIYILTGIIGGCGLICAAELIVKICEIAEQREAKKRARRRSCRRRPESAVRYEL